MSSAAITTVTKMMEALPDPLQDRIVDFLGDYIEELKLEYQWETSFNETQADLVKAARRAKEEVAEGHAEPMNYDRL